MEVVKQIADMVIEGNIDEVTKLTKEAIRCKVNIQKIMDEGFIAGLNVAGDRYSSGEFFLPEMLVSGMAVTAGMEVLGPLLTKSGVKPKGTIVIGTVVGDAHDIGKNLVCMMCEGGGFKVIDLGTDVSAQKFIDAAQKTGADIIAMSALLSTTSQNMKGVIQDIRASGLTPKLKVMVGGAPVTQDYADNIGADGYAPDAALAVKKAKELLGIG